MFDTRETKSLLRFDLKLTQDDGPGVVHTFTWGETRGHALARVVDTMDSEDGIWDGWSFELSKHGRSV